MDDLYSVPAQKIAETRNNLLGVRESLSTPEDRAEGVEKLQREAGSSYAEQRYPLALRTQLTALWLLAPGKPSLPRSLAEPATPGLAALQFVIGIGEVGAAAESPGAVRPGLAGPPSPRELRIALLLDLADTALRLEDWPTARLACETVLDRQPGDAEAEARYRLAQAYDGAGEPRRSLAALGPLLALRPPHVGATRLAAAVKKQQAAERAMYGGLFARQEEPLYSGAALRSEAEARRSERDRQLTPANLAKMPTERWAEIVGSLDQVQMDRMLEQNAEIASQLPDTMWQKHAAAYSPENIELARKAVDLHRAQGTATETGPPCGGRGATAEAAGAECDAAEGGDEEDEEDEEDTWLDAMLTRAALAALVAVAGAWAYMYLHMWMDRGSGVGPLPPLPVPPSVEL